MKSINYLTFFIFLLTLHSCQIKPYAFIQRNESEVFKQNRLRLSDNSLKTKKLSVFKELPYEKDVVSPFDSIKFEKIINVTSEENINKKHYNVTFPKDSIKKTKLLKLKPTTSTERKAKTAGIFADSSIYLGIISTIGFIINSPIFFLVFYLSSLFLGILALFFGKPTLKKLDKLILLWHSGKPINISLSLQVSNLYCV